jgi:hypothetical protein
MSKEDHTKFFDTEDYVGAEHINNIFESLFDVRFLTNDNSICGTKDDAKKHTGLNHGALGSDGCSLLSLSIEKANDQVSNSLSTIDLLLFSMNHLVATRHSLCQF